MGNGYQVVNSPEFQVLDSSHIRKSLNKEFRRISLKTSLDLAFLERLVDR